MNSGLGDQDNDVPMLTNIYDRIKILNEDIRGEREIITFNEDGSFYFSKDTNSSGYTTLSDIHKELQKANSSTQEYGSEDVEDSISTEKSTMSSAIKSVEDNLPSINTIEKISLQHNTAYIPIPDIIQPYLGASTINLFDVGETLNVDIPSFADIAKFVSLIIGLIALYYYSQAIMKLLSRTIEVMIMANESNAVTNYSILGNSVGAITVKGVKVALGLGAILSVFAMLTSVVVESVGIGSNEVTLGSLGNFFNTITNLIIGIGAFSAIAIYWFSEFVPYVSIILMFSNLAIIRFTILVLMLFSNRAMRVAS